MRINIATLFDKNYIVRTLAFYNALSKFGGKHKFWFLCLDQETKNVIGKLNLPNVTLVTIEDMGDTELAETKNNRTIAEYTFTTKPVFANYIANKLNDGEALVFSDNDVIFFRDPMEVIEKMSRENSSIGITAHKFSKKKEYLNNKVGKYNAGLLFFIMNPESRKCIADWRKNCIEWCYLIYEEERFGDQKYIMKWPQKYNGVYDIPDKGVNTGSWNLSNWKVTENPIGTFFIDDDPLICYHFHRIRFYIEGDKVKAWPINIYHDRLYSLYSDMLSEGLRTIRKIDTDWKYGFTPKPDILRLTKQRVTKFLRQIKGSSSEEE